MTDTLEVARTEPGRPTSGDPVLTVSDARKTFEARAALDGVDLCLDRGEIYALLGPNGAGKTTLIRAICGRVRLDRGEVLVNGQDPRSHTGARRALGLVPQEIALYPYLTVAENLEVLGRLAGVSRTDLPGAIEKALESTGLVGRADDRASRLSGGMQRRLNIAAGVLHDPTVLLLDEPTVGVDPRARDAIHELLRRLRGRGMSILLTTHDLDQAEILADRIGILVEGRLRADGHLEDLVGQAFGNARLLVIVLAEPANDLCQGLLAQAGLEPGIDDRHYRGPWQGDLEQLPELGRRIAEAGGEAVEIRVSEPRLREVFFERVGQEFGS